VGYQIDASGNLVDTITEPVEVDGFRLVDGRASYGLSLQSFLLGFPMHFDFSWRTLFNRAWEDLVFTDCVQTSATVISCQPTGDFRKMKFDFWMGYDF